MSIFSEASNTQTFKPEPQSRGFYLDGEQRFTGDYNGKVTITKKEEIMNGPAKGSIILHMTSPVLKEKDMEIRDIFPRRKDDTPFETWAMTQINRVTGAMKSAGMEVPASVKVQDLDKLLENLIGKEVVVSQWTPKGNQYPRLNYKFQEDTVADLSNLPM